MIDITRGLFVLAAAAAAGALIWVATFFELASPDEFWAVMGILAGGGIVLGFARSVGAMHVGLRPRFNVGVFLVGFLPAAVVGAWILLATQPAGGWQQQRLESWSSDIGVGGLVADIGVFAAVIAFGLGLLLTWSLGTVTEPRAAVVEDDIVVDADTDLRLPYETRDRVPAS
jgi:hypothetical protein